MAAGRLAMWLPQTMSKQCCFIALWCMWKVIRRTWNVMEGAAGVEENSGAVGSLPCRSGVISEAKA